MSSDTPEHPQGMPLIKKLKHTNEIYGPAALRVLEKLAIEHHNENPDRNTGGSFIEFQDPITGKMGILITDGDTARNILTDIDGFVKLNQLFDHLKVNHMSGLVANSPGEIPYDMYHTPLTRALGRRGISNRGEGEPFKRAYHRARADINRGKIIDFTTKVSSNVMRDLLGLDIDENEFERLRTSNSFAIQLSVLGGFLGRNIPFAQKQSNRAHRLLGGFIKKTSDNGIRENSLLGILNTVRPNLINMGLTDSDIDFIDIGHLLTLIEAGTSTTAHAMAQVLNALGSDLNLQAEIRQELFENPGGRSAILDSLIKECLYQYPPTLLILRQTSRNVSLGGRDISEGTTVIVSPELIQKLDRLYKNEDKFDPKRFLDQNGAALIYENPAKGGRYDYLPFGAGPRTCIGALLALTEIYTTVSLLLQDFELRASGPEGQVYTGVVRGPNPKRRLILTPIQNEA